MQAATHLTPLGRNESSAREGIDTLLLPLIGLSLNLRRNESSAREGIDTLCTPFATIMITEVEMSHQPERALTRHTLSLPLPVLLRRNESSAREGIDTKTDVDTCLRVFFE